jgi:hypothetical protein
MQLAHGGKHNPTEKYDTAIESAVENAEHGALARRKQRCKAESGHEKAESPYAKQHQALQHTLCTDAPSKKNTHRQKRVESHGV